MHFLSQPGHPAFGNLWSRRWSRRTWECPSDLFLKSWYYPAEGQERSLDHQASPLWCSSQIVKPLCVRVHSTAQSDPYHLCSGLDKSLKHEMLCSQTCPGTNRASLLSALSSGLKIPLPALFLSLSPALAGEGNDNPLQYSCLGNPTDRKA